jgi:hypothetical protein
MYDVSPRFLDEIRKPIHTIRVKMEVLNLGLNPVEGGTFYGMGEKDKPTNYLVDGVVDVDVARGTRRTFTATLLNPEGIFAPGSAWAGMFYVNRIVRLFRGVSFGDATEYVCLGTFMLDNVDIIVERNMSVVVMSGADLWKKVAKADLPHNVKYTAGTHVNAIIRDVAGACGVSELNLDPLDNRPAEDRKLPKDRNYDSITKWGDLLRKVADTFGLDVYFDTFGTLVSQDTTTAQDKAVVWTFEPGTYEVMSQLRSSYNDDILWNGVKVVGTGDKNVIYHSVVHDTDPDSVTNINRIGRRTYKRETDDVSTQGQADRLAARLFDLRCLRVRNELNIESVCLPFFEGNDVVRIIEDVHSGTNTKSRLRVFSIPLTGSRQTLKTQRVVRVKVPTVAISGPDISNVNSTEVNESMFDITWVLSEPATGRVEYGTTSDYGEWSVSEDSYLYSSHTIRLTNLLPGTLYHYRVRSINQAGGVSISGDYTLTTDSAITGPTISNVTSDTYTDTTARIQWDLSEVGTGQVEYGTTPGYGQWGTYEASLSYNYHIQTLRNLLPGTEYHFRVHSTNQTGGASVSGDYTFSTTGGGGAPVGPVISGVGSSQVTTTTAVIGWSVSQPADGRVEYGPSTSYGSLSSLVTGPFGAHSIALSGLTPDRTYHYRCLSSNANGAAVSADYIFVTPPQSGGGGNIFLVYGTGINADGKSDRTIPQNIPKADYRFRATQSSSFIAFVVQWRVHPSNIAYSKGDGGRFRFRLCPDDGSANNFPVTGTVLAEFTIDVDQISGVWPFQDAASVRRHLWPTPYTLVNGTIYHIVVENIATDPANNYASLNQLHCKQTYSQRQPMWANPDMAFLYGSGSSWAVDPSHTPNIDIEYANGKHDGMAYQNNARSNYGLIGGADRVRERFVVPAGGGNKRVTGLFWRCNKQSGSGLLTMTLETSGGSSIESKAAPGSNSLPGWVLDENSDTGEWTSITFDQTRTLTAGSGYNAVLTAASGTQYATVPLSARAANDINGEYFKSHRFSEGFAEKSSNSGGSWSYMWSSWSDYVNNQFYFTLE